MQLFHSAQNPPSTVTEFSQLIHGDVLGYFVKCMCYRLNCVPFNINMLKPYPPMWWSLALGGWLGLDEIMRVEASGWVSATVRTDTRELALPAVWGQWESSWLQAWNQNQPGWHTDPEFQPPELWDNKLLLLKTLIYGTLWQPKIRQYALLKQKY